MITRKINLSIFAVLLLVAGVIVLLASRFMNSAESNKEQGDVNLGGASSVDDLPAFPPVAGSDPSLELTFPALPPVIGPE